MSRYVPSHPNSSAVLQAAETWRRLALEANGSVFSESQLWEPETIGSLKTYFVERLAEGGGSYMDKLKAQLSEAGAEANQLAAEMNWLLMLCPSNTGADAKRNIITEIWGWSGVPISSDHPLLSDDVLGGIGSGGPAYNTNRWRELIYLIRVIEAWKQLGSERCASLINDEWAMSEWFGTFPEASSRQLRHMLLWLLFPDSFERIFGGEHRRRIVSVFSGKSTQEVGALEPIEIDRELLAIRESQEQRYEGRDLDFYEEPLNSQWNPLDPDVNEDTTHSTMPYSIEEAVEDLFIERERFESILELLTIKKNIVLQGPPGVGKTYFSKRLAYALMGEKDRLRLGMVQFHQSYSYEDFVQGFRPSGDGFRLRDGIFHQFCAKARLDPGRDYIFIIDEINRGNLSKVFGELMMLIEADKRGEEWSIPLAYSDGIDEQFYVPENLYIIGLMNTADRSLAMVDYALRRRFGFIDLEPGFHTDQFREFLIERGSDESFLDRVIDRLSIVNEKISSDQANLGKGYQIGHSYFTGLVGEEPLQPSSYKRVVEWEIAPLLREYWFDNLDVAERLVEELMMVD